MNFAGVTWYVLGATHSTVKVSLIVILVTLPGLVVPPFGGVLIDRVDRRYLGMTVDAARAVIVLGTAALAYAGHLALWELYSMVLILGVGFAIYWSTTNALVQELVPRETTEIAANATVLIAVQGGMAAAGALVGFTYEHTGLAGILGIDGTTYLFSAICLLLLRRGYYAPHETQNLRLLSASPTIEAPPEMSEPFSGLRKRWTTESPREHPRCVRGYCRRAGIPAPTASRAGIGNYLCLHDGRSDQRKHTYCGSRKGLALRGRNGIWMDSGGLGDSARSPEGSPQARRRVRNPYRVLILALATLAVGHTLFPYAHLLIVAALMNALFGACRALGGVLTQSAIMTTVPRRLMGRTQSAFSVIGTVLQLAMSFTLGWFAQQRHAFDCFLVALGAIYGVARFWRRCGQERSPLVTQETLNSGQRR